MNARGTYALLLHLAAPRTVVVGALGAVNFPPGWYVYLGSAHGPGGLAARVARHRRRVDKRFHWHIDYVRAVSTLIEVWTNCNNTKLECKWATVAATLPGANAIAPHLGSSDCQCPSHLFHFARRPEPSEFEPLIQAELEIEHVDDGGVSSDCELTIECSRRAVHRRDFQLIESEEEKSIA